LPRSGGINAAHDIAFNPYAAPFIPSTAPPEFIDSTTQEPFENTRGQTYRENMSFAFDQRGSRPFRPMREYNRSRIPNAGVVPNTAQGYQAPNRNVSNKNRGGQVQGRRRTVRRMDSDDQSYQDKPMRGEIQYLLLHSDFDDQRGIWSCKTCYHMFHISNGCIINWAKKSREDDNKWRCPTCQTKYGTIPYNYFCFCGKQRNPNPPIGEVPHSCGNICGGQRAPGCPHRCNEPCHPGPCPECPVMLTKRCNCGNVQKAIRCGSAVEVKCDKVCDRLLACGKHRCEQVCHEGNCGRCELKIIQKQILISTLSACFCGSSSREVLCYEKGDSDSYSCGAPCSGMYTCGVHQCTRSCHLMGDSGCGPCPSAPERITHCPCGRCTLEELGIERKSCHDPIPTCKNVCAKVLKCGAADKKHRCRALCHQGECPPCDLNTSVVCRCKQVKRTLPCVEYVHFAGEFLCEKRCKKRKSCGIHKCQELCCVQKEHLCLQICNKRLSCGLHFCESICHAGQCPRCLNSSFEEQYCHCGRTMRPPPVPCGAPLPECDEPCARPHACNHPVTHHCHGDERCPPCTALVERMCYGKHELRKNIPCHIEAVSCGRLCDKPLGCGVHNCNRNCHAGDCMREGEKCTRPCMILRRPCEHPCSLPCHGLDPCPESECRHPVNVTCECGKRRSTLKCVEVRFAKRKESEGDPSNESAGVGSLKRSASMEKLNCLPCDDECKKSARNKKLAEALKLVTDENGMLEREPTITFTEYMKVELRTNAAFVTESSAQLFSCFQPTFLGSSLNHNFRPMSVDKRRFIHEYAVFFSIETAGVDDPPKRSVIATAKSSFNDDPKRKSEQAAEEASTTSSMKALRGGRLFKKRVAPELARPAPLPQFNHFAVLRSDDEDTEPQAPSRKADNVKNPDWWSDEEEEEEIDSSDGADQEIIALMKDIVLQVCETERRDEQQEHDLLSAGCKDSWSDEE
uniref:R3H domain-containing protein n=1 Tax=Haemonchus placei TaxID=6290 RepID=A0A0N4WGQ3_HAEPC